MARTTVSKIVYGSSNLSSPASGARGGTGLNRTQLGTKYGARKPHFYLNNTPIISNGQQLIDSVVPL